MCIKYGSHSFVIYASREGSVDIWLVDMSDPLGLLFKPNPSWAWVCGGGHRHSDRKSKCFKMDLSQNEAITVQEKTVKQCTKYAIASIPPHWILWVWNHYLRLRQLNIDNCTLNIIYIIRNKRINHIRQG